MDFTTIKIYLSRKDINRTMEKILNTGDLFKNIFGKVKLEKKVEKFLRETQQVNLSG